MDCRGVLETQLTFWPTVDTRNDVFPNCQLTREQLVGGGLSYLGL